MSIKGLASVNICLIGITESRRELVKYTGKSLEDENYIGYKMAPHELIGPFIQRNLIRAELDWLGGHIEYYLLTVCPKENPQSVRFVAN